MSARDCPFCPGNEHLTPAATAVYTDQGVASDGAERVRPWKMRAFPNLFAAMVPSPAPPTTEWIALPGHGYHEVIVDTPGHADNPADFSHEHMMLLLQAYKDRYSYYRYLSQVSYVSIFKNWGRESGASLAHSHSQVIAIPIMPPLMKREIDAIFAAPFCLFCNVVLREAASARAIAQNESWVQIAPFYSQVPYETWILPKGHISNLEEMDDEQHRGLASILGDAMRRMRALLDDPPYNLMIYQLASGYHLNIRIQPAITKIAGFERGTGVFINPVPPEQAAAELRQA